MTSWVVVLRTGVGNEKLRVYGPLADESDANEFAKFMTSEVDPATSYRVHDPIDELLGWYHAQSTDRMDRTEHWPPRPGDVWQDSQGARWCCQQDGTLACLASKADDTAGEIFRCYGPMTLVSRPSPVEEECPF